MDTWWALCLTLTGDSNSWGALDVYVLTLYTQAGNILLTELMKNPSIYDMQYAVPKGFTGNNEQTLHTQQRPISPEECDYLGVFNLG